MFVMELFNILKNNGLNGVMFFIELFKSIMKSTAVTEYRIIAA